MVFDEIPTLKDASPAKDEKIDFFNKPKEGGFDNLDNDYEQDKAGGNPFGKSITKELLQ